MILGDAAPGAVVAFTPSPAVTPANLICNPIAIPGALLRFHDERRLGGPLVRLLILDTLRGVVAGGRDPRLPPR